jgi:hypothetical protein
MMFVHYKKHIWVFTVCYGDIFAILYVDDIRTSQEAHLWDFTVCYGDRFTLLYVDDVRTSQEAHLWAFTLLCEYIYFSICR